MAIYRTGTASMTAAGVVTGVGTKWKDSLSLIRVGATIVFLTNPLNLATISAIVSDTELRVITSDAAAVPAGAKYVILLHDSITVDGLAQDVAETLRYYQGKESEIADAIELIENFDFDKLKAISEQVKSDAASAGQSKTAASASQQAAAQSQSAAAGYATTSGQARDQAQQANTAAQSAKTDAIAARDTARKYADSVNPSLFLKSSNNLNDVVDKPAARSSLGLSEAATRGISEYVANGSSGLLLTEGSAGLWSYNGMNGSMDGRYNERSGIYAGPGAGSTNWFDEYSPMFVMNRYQNTYGMFQIGVNTGRAAVRGRNGNNFTPWNELYTTGNTTKASDGTLKAASPVARIVNSQDENLRKDVDEDGFTWCGCGTSNAEAEGINIYRLDTGVYVLTGSAGLASEGWQLLPPMDPAGMGELGIVEAEQTESGGLTIRLFRRKFMLTESGEMMKTKGEPIDVPTNSWIDIRLDMPENSIWNTRSKESSQE